MITHLSARLFHALIAVVALVLLAIAFYMEYQMGLEPCPLCMMQRIVFALIGIVALISALHGRSAPRYASVVVVLTVLGAMLSLRHLYLQNLPPNELPACLPGLSYMFEVFPWQEIFQSMIMGTGECGEVSWRFLGLSIPGWTLVAFVGMALTNLWIVFINRRQS